MVLWMALLDSLLGMADVMADITPARVKLQYVTLTTAGLRIFLLLFLCSRSLAALFIACMARTPIKICLPTILPFTSTLILCP
jgi:hypothetical protein